MKKPEPTKPATQKWEALAKSLAPLGVELSAMFGMPALKFSGKAFGSLFGNSVVFKLEGQSHVLFDPSGMGRPMKAGWCSWPPITSSAARPQQTR